MNGIDLPVPEYPEIKELSYVPKFKVIFAIDGKVLWVGLPG